MQDNELNIIYEDNHLIVVMKPQMIACCPDESGDDNLFDCVKRYIKTAYGKPGNVYLGLVHRLDRPTGGVMVFAKTSKAAARLSEQMKNAMIVVSILPMLVFYPFIQKYFVTGVTIGSVKG